MEGRVASLSAGCGARAQDQSASARSKLMPTWRKSLNGKSRQCRATSLGLLLRESASWEAGRLRRGRPTPAPPPSLRSPRLSPKHRGDGRKTGNQRSSGSRSPSPSGGSGWGSPQQNGGSRQRSGAHGGRPGSAHSPPDVRTLGFAEGSPLRFRGLRRACGMGPG